MTDHIILEWIKETCDAYCIPKPLAIIEALEAARATADQGEPRLDKRAQVGNTRFGVGVRWSTVIGAAQRYHDYMATPEKESERIEKGKAFLDLLTACSAADHRDSVIETLRNALVLMMDVGFQHLPANERARRYDVADAALAAIESPRSGDLLDGE